MARSVAGSRGSVASKGLRTSRHRGSATRRHKLLEGEHESARPDTDELRRLREAYYSRPRKDRVRATSVRSSTTAKASSHAERSKRSSMHIRERSQKSGKQPDRTQEYVYGSAPAVEVTLETEHDEPASHSSRRVRSSKSPVSTQIETASAMLDVEVTPDDSVSQVGSRAHRSRRPIRTTLRSIAEEPSATTKGRRDSFLGSIFGRRTSSTVAAPKLVECLTCGADDIPAAKAAKLECDHRMCHSCLRRIFRLAVQDPAHMPPKCCTEHHIPLKLVDRLFDIRFKVLFNKKYAEYNTRNRVYCPNKKCGIWIRPAYYHKSGGRRFAQCNKCKTKACISCGMKLHKASDCPKDPEIAKLVEQGEQQGWKRCYDCKAMVELGEGCNHMTCRCGAQFCMVCGAKWKSCDCAWFSNAALPGFVRGYGVELQHRRYQVREDEDLARLMQFATLLDPQPRDVAGFGLWGVGNRAGHFMNDDFVQENVRVMDDGSGDAAAGRRGERASVR